MGGSSHDRYNKDDVPTETAPVVEPVSERLGNDDEFEIFHDGDGRINYRTVGWIRASSIFLKIIFATGVLTIPSSMAVLGAVPASLCIIGFMALCTYTAILYGNYRARHPGIHTSMDIARVMGGLPLELYIGFLYLFGLIFSGGSAILGGSVGLNVLSDHAICTQVFNVVIGIAIAATASIPRLHSIGWLTWAGFFSIFIAILICCVGVTTLERPYSAPQSGPFNLGYYLFPPTRPSYIEGMTAALIIFCSCAGIPAFVPVISEMKNPKDYNKAVYACMGFVTAAYLTFALIIYRYCGTWVASPALGSAGPVLEKVSYGIGLIGLIAAGTIWIHVAAKYLFVRLLRNSRHLQERTATHWIMWLSIVNGFVITGYVLANAVPFYAYIFALLCAFAWAPTALALPLAAWFHDYNWKRKGTAFQKISWCFNAALFIFSLFLVIGGTYATIAIIKQAFDRGDVVGIFVCDDNR